MAIRFLKKDDERNPRNFSGIVSGVSRAHDRRSYCSNSDLFYNNMQPIATRELSKEECKRQAECYRT